jgi:hypothetical protein
VLHELDVVIGFAFGFLIKVGSALFQIRMTTIIQRAIRSEEMAESALLAAFERSVKLKKPFNCELMRRQASQRRLYDRFDNPM